ncbi:MAG: hypothetical protein CSA22_03600 [Deltaproteobacteria bacterium]|nr:MAG: hypothetical protein CSA22_03600 [Deltaproteobacteria bacterium]
MLSKKRMGLAVAVAVVAVLAVLAGIGLLGTTPEETLVFGDNPSLPTLTFYTTGLATTPQIPFWAAVDQGEILKHCNLEVKFWKNLDDLRGVLLAGKGDLWLGHTEGFIQARKAGAPVSMLYVSGWRKFYLLTRGRQEGGFSAFAGKELAFAPAGSPAVPVLEALGAEGTDRIRFKPFEPRQLSLMLMSGKLDAAMVPEPLVTRLLSRVEGLVVSGCVEDLYGEATGGLPRMPIAGMAVNRHTAQRLPDTIQAILAAVLQTSKQLEQTGNTGIESLPDAFAAFVDKETVQKSLERDYVHVEAAADVRDEIVQYVGLFMPEVLDTAAINVNSWFWRR